MKTRFFALALLAGSSLFAQSRFSVGVQIGGYGQGYYQQAPAYVSQRPPCPGPDYGWVDGYWAQDYGRRSWVAGYWNRQRFEQPRYENRYRENERRESFNRRDERGRDRDDRRDNNRDSRQDYNRFGNGFRGR